MDFLIELIGGIIGLLLFAEIIKLWGLIVAHLHIVLPVILIAVCVGVIVALWSLMVAHLHIILPVILVIACEGIIVYTIIVQVKKRKFSNNIFSGTRKTKGKKAKKTKKKKQHNTLTTVPEIHINTIYPEKKESKLPSGKYRAGRNNSTGGKYNIPSAE